MAGAGWFGLINGGLGGTNPYDEAAQWSDETRKRNRAAVGLDENGNPLPADPNNPANNGQSAAMGQALATGVQPPGQQPNATKTDPSLGHILMDMTQYQQREQGFNQAMGAGFAAVSQPRDREWVSKIFNVNEPDATKLMGQEQDLASQQQGQDAANSVRMIANDPVKGPLLAQQLHMDWGALKTMLISDPGAAGKIAQQLGTPTDAMRNLAQLQHMTGAGGPSASDPTMSDIKAGVVGSVAGQENAPMISAQAAWRAAHKGQPDSAMPWSPNDLASFKQWQVDEKAKSDDRQTASNELIDKNEATLTLKSDLEKLKDSPGLHQIMTLPGHRDLARNAMSDSATDIPTIMARWGLSNEEANTVALLKRIGGATTETAMRGMAGTGTRVTQAEVGPLKDAVSMTQNLNQSYEDYVHGAINNAITKTKRAVAANYGATGNVKNMDPEFSPWLNDAFKKGGQLYKEGSGADELKGADPIPPQEIADGKELLAAKPYLRDEMLDNWQQRGLDVSKLRGKNPSKW